MLANATIRPSRSTTATGNRATYACVEEAEREALLGDRLCARSQSSDTARSCGHDRRHFAGGHDAERARRPSRAAAAPAGSFAARPPSSVNAARSTRGFLAELHERQPEVGVAMQVRPCRLRRTPARRRSRRSARGTGGSASAAGSGGPTGSPSATQVRPCTPYITKPRRALVEQQRLVAQVDEIRIASHVCAAITCAASSRSASVGSARFVRRAARSAARARTSSSSDRRADRRRAGTATPRRAARTATTARSSSRRA